LVRPRRGGASPRPRPPHDGPDAARPPDESRAALADDAESTPRRRRRTVHGIRIDRATVSALGQTLAALPLGRRRRLAGLKAERADVIVAGAVVLDEIMTLGGYPAVTACTN
jgi:exopolyphosphatase/pppGpp-phosphohydrolase